MSKDTSCGRWKDVHLFQKGRIVGIQQANKTPKAVVLDCFNWTKILKHHKYINIFSQTEEYDFFFSKCTFKSGPMR